MNNLITILVYGLLLCNSVVVIAQEVANNVSNEPIATQGSVYCPDKPSYETEWIDRTHQEMSENICHALVWFYGMFRDLSGKEQQIETYASLRPSIKWNEENAFSFSLNVRANLKVHDDIGLSFLGYDTNEEATEQEKLENQAPESNKAVREEEKYYSLDLRWKALEDDKHSFSINPGIRLRSVKPYIKLRYKYWTLLNPDLYARFTQTVFWRRRDGFGTTSWMELDHPLSRSNLLRWGVGGTFSESSEGVDWSTDLSLFRYITNKKALRFRVGLSGATRPDVLVKRYHTSVLYRRNIYRPWLFLEVEPEWNFLKDEEDEERRSIWGLILRLEIVF